MPDCYRCILHRRYEFRKIIVCNRQILWVSPVSCLFVYRGSFSILPGGTIIRFWSIGLLIFLSPQTSEMEKLNKWVYLVRIPIRILLLRSSISNVIHICKDKNTRILWMDDYWSVKFQTKSLNYTTKMSHSLKK